MGKKKDWEMVKKNSCEKKEVKNADNDKCASSAKVSCIFKLRNLPKRDLAGVIFGCKNNTIEECFQGQLFGLPQQHYAYVQHIDPGLPLFLFNYNDRTLHGVFEAASAGQRNINKYGWLEDGAATTPYPAQARFRVRKLYHPLAEYVYKPIISKNYYEPWLFCFELDRSQTRQLISLFSSFPITPSTPLPNLTQKLYALLKGSSSRGALQRKEGAELSNRHPADLELGSSRNDQYPSLMVQRKVDDKCVLDEGKNKQEGVWLDTNSGHSYSSIVKNEALPVIQTNQSTISGISRIDHVAKEPNTYEHIYDADGKHSGDPSLPEQSEPSESDTSKIATENHNINLVEVPDDWEYFVIQDDKIQNGKGDAEFQDMPSSCDYAFDCLREETALGLESTSLYPFLLKLQQEVDELKVRKVEQDQKIHFLEQELVVATSENQKLKDERKMVECTLFSLLGQLKLEDCDTSKQSIFVAGGFDGSSWLSKLECYSPSVDLVRFVCPMSSARSKYAATELNGELYVIGGSVENLWCDTVESYNPVTERWTNRPALTKPKESLAGVSFGDKIVIVGGGNGVECFSEVEIFDPQAGRWILSKPMLQKRYVPSATQINGVLYVVGGYNGSNYLSSLERYDPREFCWTEQQSMKTKRGCHALAVLNDKLYTFGGYDGDRMVSSNEVFDPRMNMWFTEVPMNVSRGYFGTAVVGDSIYAIGGVNDNLVLDTVEIYREGHGWKMTDLKGIGKRGFFSAVVL